MNSLRQKRDLLTVKIQKILLGHFEDFNRLDFFFSKKVLRERRTKIF